MPNRREVLQLIGKGMTAFALSSISGLPKEAHGKEPHLQYRKVIVQNAPSGCSMSPVGPGWYRLGKYHVEGGKPIVMEGVPVMNEESGEKGGVWINGSCLSPSSISEPGDFLPVHAAPAGHDLIIDLGPDNPGLGYYQLNIHSLKEKIIDENIRPKRQPHIVVCDWGITPNNPAMAVGLADGSIVFAPNFNAQDTNYRQEDEILHGTSTVDIVKRYSPPGTIIHVAKTKPYQAYDKAVRWAANMGYPLLIANLEYGPLQEQTPERQQLHYETLVYANNNGLAIITANGNYGREGYSGKTDHTPMANLYVGAMQNGGRPKDYSNYDPDIVGPTDVLAARGVNSETNHLDGKENINIFSGTSAATPAVGGMLAWQYMYTDVPALTLAEVVKMQDACTDIYPSNSPLNRRDGSGIPDAVKTFRILQQMGY